MMLSRVIAGLLVTILASPINAESAALQALQSGLGDAINIAQTPYPTIQYCPDNTCDEFRGKDLDNVADFALLYLWYISDYTYLKSWRQKSPPQEIQALLSRFAPSCGMANERERLVCTLLRLANNAEIQIFFVRYDEGQVIKELIDLDNEMNRSK